jgi:hypothetical protein
MNDYIVSYECLTSHEILQDNCKGYDIKQAENFYNTVYGMSRIVVDINPA